MFSLTLVNSFMLYFLIMITLTTTAPTHHLTIGVQGNTPTLIVTSSEIGITPETMAANEKPLKAAVLTKPLKDLKSSERHKTLKTKLNKNHSLLNKKEKLQFMAKPLTKQSLFKNDAKENINSTSNEVKTEEYKEPSVSLTKDSMSFKHSKENRKTIKQQPQEIDDITPNTMLVQIKEENNIKPPIELDKQQPQMIKNSTIFTTTTLTSIEEAKDVKTTTLGPKENPEISTTTIFQSSMNDKEMKTTSLETSSQAEENQYITTISSPLSPKKTIEFTLPPPKEDISTATTTTDSLPSPNMRQAKDLINTLELSTASGLEEITDIFTATINNDDTSNIATTPKALRDSSTTGISTNDDVAATATEKHIIDKETTTTKSENDNDRNTENTTLLRNENQLFTATQTMTMTTSASHLATLTANNAIAETATIMTTTGIHGDDEEQQALTKSVDDAVVQAKSITDNKPHRSSRHSDNNKNNSVQFKSRQEYKITISTTPAINRATIYSHTSTDDDETITTENPLATMIPTTIEEFKTNEQSVIETDIETTVTTTSTPLIKNEQQQQETTIKAIDFSRITPKFRDYDETTATTEIEKGIKLIDLEKHDDLKHTSLSSLQQHHDNGHDGLKNIKKKQLIDKHYVEALIHTKQEVTDNNNNNPAIPEPMDGLNTPPTVTSSTIHSYYTTTASTTPYTKPLLLPIKHGFLGPILMEEKTFHVIHHPAYNTNDAKANKIPHLSSLETQLRNGHFVELKAKAEIEPTTETITTTSSNNNIKYTQETTAVTNKIEVKGSKTQENLENIATDLNTTVQSLIIYKDDLSGNVKDKSATDSFEFENKKYLQKSTANFDTILKSAAINKDDLSINSNYKSLHYFSESGNKQDLPKSVPVADLTVESTTSIAEDISRNQNYKSSEDSSGFVARSLLPNKDSKQDLQKSSLEYSPQNSLPKLTTVLPDTVQSTISGTGVKSVITNKGRASADSLEFGFHKILLKSAALQNSPVKSLATNKDEYLPQLQQSSDKYSLHFDQQNNMKNPAKVLSDTVQVLNKFYTENENKSIYKNTTVKSKSGNKEYSLTGRRLFEDPLDLNPPTYLYNSEKAVQASQKFYTKSENNEENKELLKPDLPKEDKLQKSSTNLTTTVATLKALPSKAVLDVREKNNEASLSSSLESQPNEDLQKTPTVLSTTVFQIADSVATKTPIVQANTLFNSPEKGYRPETNGVQGKTESKISDIQIEVYDSTIDSIVSSTNFKDNDNNPIYSEIINDDTLQGKTTKPPVSLVQQERFTQYVIDRTETSTPEPINYSTIQVGSGKPEPAAIEIHINVSESFGNESEDLEFSYPQTEYNTNKNNNQRVVEESYDDNKINDNINIKIPSNSGSNSPNKDSRSDEILVVEIIDTDNNTDQMQSRKSKNSDDLFISENTPPPPPPPPPYQPYFDRDSDTIFYISNTEVKVGESIPTAKNSYEERKLKLESQFFPANYMASTHPNINTAEDSNAPHHLYEEDIILSSNRNQADSLKIYRNRNEPSPPLDVTYVGESIIEVEQSPDSTITTTYVPDQQPHIVTQQADVIIQPAILPEISIGVPVIGELPPQIELKEIDFMPNEVQLHRSGIYEENDNSNNNLFNNDIDDNTINAGSTGYNSHDLVDNINNNQRLDESSIQYGGDLIDESADGGFDGVEGSYPFGNPNSAAAAAAASISASMTTTRKQQQNHVADYAHLYVNYGVNNMRKDELSADVKESGELIAVGGGGVGTVGSNVQNITSFKGFLNKVSINNSSYINGNLTQTERMSNATAFSVLEDVNDLEDKNTEDIVNLISLAIGLFIVILPVVVTCSMFWALRYLYKKYHSNVADSSGYSDQTDTKGQMNDDGVEKGEFIHEPPPTSSSPTNSDKDDIQKFTDTSNNPSTTDSIVKFSTEKSFQLNQISSGSKTKDSLQLSLALHSSALATDIQTVHDDIEMAGPNGSITKMTLENNLLIVETEERNDMSRVARETKMDYNKDGVFVVEVARGIDSKNIPESPVTEGSEKMLSMFDTKHNNGILGYKVTNEKNCLGNEKVQIHSPPPENPTEEGPRSLHQIEEVEEPSNSPHLYDDGEAILGLAYKSKTGLSQSDLSITSSNDSNKGYCYGNQALYVVEQNGYSTMSPTGNVAIKCDSKDIKDEDHNPENDHYLEHSPDKKDDQKDKEDIEETIKSQDGSESKVSEEKSPRQRAGDKEKLHEEFIKDDKEVQYLEHIIESVITKALEADSHKDILNEVVEKFSTTDLNTITEISAPTEFDKESSISKELPLSNENQILLLAEESLKIVESSSAMKHPVEPPILDKSSVLQDTPLSIEPVVLVVEPVIQVVEDTIFAAPDKFSDHIALENRINTQNDIEYTESENFSNNSLTENGVISETVADNDHIISENILTDTEVISLQLKEIHEISLDKPYLSGERSEIEIQVNSLKTNFIEEHDLKEKSTEIDVKSLKNGVESLTDLTTELKSTSLQNGHISSVQPVNCFTEMENGYDSIMSLPEPPPTTEEQLNNDLSDQQLDSLPPPPPPEIFNLKDLPPPLTNGTDTDSLPSEESNNFYNTLPPPPPTTLEVSATNGKMHASPLTPPASPPAHFTNNLHAGLCAQPIAVDVNGS